MPRNHFQAPGLLVALGLAILFSSTSLSTESHAQVTAKEACSIAMVKATQRAAKCLGLAQIRSIRGGWLAEKLEEHIDRCERKHSRAFRRAERRAESRGAACEADGNDIFAQHLLGRATQYSALGDVSLKLNEQFNNGDPADKAYTSLSDAGVLAHQWDGSNKAADTPWIPTVGSVGHSVLGISSSLTNAKLKNPDGYTGLYTLHTDYTSNGLGPAGGMIYSTDSIDAEKPIAIGCMQALDAGTDNRLNAACGCPFYGNHDAGDYYNMSLYPQQPLTVSDDIPESTWHQAQNSCGSNLPYTREVKYWSQCNTASATATTFAHGNCFSKAVPDDNLNWYIDGEKVEGASQLKAIMQSTEQNCKTVGTSQCYNEIVVKTAGLYEGVSPTPVSTPPTIGNPKPGAILAFFYLDTATGHYPPNLDPDSGGKWDPNHHNGQCDTYTRWLAYRNTPAMANEKAPLIEFDLAAASDPFTTICDDPEIPSPDPACAAVHALCGQSDE